MTIDSFAANETINGQDVSSDFAGAPNDGVVVENKIITGDQLYADNGATLTIKDSQVNVTGDSFTTGGGTINVENSTVTSGVWANYKDGNKGIVDLTNSTVSGDYFVAQGGGDIKVDGGTVNVGNIWASHRLVIDDQVIPSDGGVTTITFSNKANVTAEQVYVGATPAMDGIPAGEGIGDNLYVDSGSTFTAQDVHVNYGDFGAETGATVSIKGTLELKNGAFVTFDASDNQGNGAKATLNHVVIEKGMEHSGRLYIGDDSVVTANDIRVTGAAGVTGTGADTTDVTAAEIRLEGNSKLGKAPSLTVNDVSVEAGTIRVEEGAQMTSNTLSLSKGASLYVVEPGSSYTVTGRTDISRDSDIEAAIHVDKGVLTFASGSELHISDGAQQTRAAAAAPIHVANGGTVHFADNSSAYTTADETNTVKTVVQNDGGTVKIDAGAKLFVENAKDDGKEYDFTKVVSDNSASFQKIYGATILTTLNEDGKTFGTTEDVSVVLPEAFGAAAATAAMLSGEGAAYDFVSGVLGKDVDTNAERTAYLNSAAGLTQLAGVTHGTYGFSQRVAGLIEDHEADSDGIWAAYIREDKTVDGFKVGSLSADYDLKYNGFILGGDFAKTANSHTGAAFAYADGDVSTNGGLVSTKNDAKYYAGSVYHVREQGDMTYRAEIGYVKSSNDLTQYNFGTKITGSPDASAIHAGIRAEKAIETASGVWAPYIGLDYFHVNTDDYTDSLGFRHDTDNANLWNVPVGVQYRHEVKSGSWTVAPLVEVGYLFALGDKDVDETYSYGSASDVFRSDIAESGFIGKIGVAARKDSMSYELHYGYQKGSDVESNQWGVQVSYAF